MRAIRRLDRSESRSFRDRAPIPRVATSYVRDSATRRETLAANAIVRVGGRAFVRQCIRATHR